MGRRHLLCFGNPNSQHYPNHFWGWRSRGNEHKTWGEPKLVPQFSSLRVSSWDHCPLPQYASTLQWDKFSTCWVSSSIISTSNKYEVKWDLEIPFFRIHFTWGWWTTVAKLYTPFWRVAEGRLLHLSSVLLRSIYLWKRKEKKKKKSTFARYTSASSKYKFWPLCQ